jgi:glycine cleavage system H protein
MEREQKTGPSGELLERNGSSVIIKFTQTLCSHLGEIVWIDLPAVGKSVQQGDVVVVLESGKAAHDYVSPLSGKIIAVNQEVAQSPTLLSSKSTWIFQLEDLDEEEWALLQ